MGKECIVYYATLISLSSLLHMWEKIECIVIDELLDLNCEIHTPWTEVQAVGGGGEGILAIKC